MSKTTKDKTTNDNANVTLVEFKTKQRQEEEKLDAAVKEAVQSCYDNINIEDARGLLTIVIDGEGNPDILFAGAMEPFKVVGILELAKTLFVNMATEGSMEIEDYTQGDNDE